ncbi:hypothetical protein P5673_023504 [Acropora cervicornis]|uniref:Uncharacterized protein n=1 Tax=Acropora cervicornis TaxID=6130 RepID=A0AAD9Q506_ACRCE|nr:hypothetical protein P5673_023504 [Acropora cervicornis]
MLSVLQNVQENSSREDWFFWAAETTSGNGRKGPVITGFDQTRLFDKIKAMIHGLSIEREQHDQWRQLRRQQEDDLQQMISGTHHQLGIVEDNLVANECQAINQTQEQPEDKSEADMIRERRSERLRKEPHHSIKIIICLNNGSRIKRSFDKGVLFQDEPLYFTLHRGGKLVHHKEEVEGNSVLHLTKRGKEEAATLVTSEAIKICLTSPGQQAIPSDKEATESPGSLSAQLMQQGKQTPCSHRRKPANLMQNEPKQEEEQNRMTTERAKETEEVQEVTHSEDKEGEGKKKRKKKAKRSNRRRKT